MSIEDKNTFNKLVLELCSGLYKSEDYAKIREMYTNGDVTDDWTEEKFKESSQLFIPKKDLPEVNEKLQSIFEKLKEKGNFTTKLEELIEVVDLNPEKQMYPNYMPLHARLGFKQHIGRSITEEFSMLEDMVYQFLYAQYLLNDFNKLVGLVKKDSINDPQFNTFYQVQKLNLISTCRIGIQQCFNFTYSFTRSIMQDYCKKNDKETLEEPSDISEFIRNTISLINPEVDFEPFNTLLDGLKEYETKVLPSIIGYTNGEIDTTGWSDADWMRRYHQIYTFVKGAAAVVWNGSFPDADAPQYMNNLNYESMEKNQELRLPIAQNKRRNYVYENFKKDSRSKRRKKASRKSKK